MLYLPSTHTHTNTRAHTHVQTDTHTHVIMQTDIRGHEEARRPSGERSSCGPSERHPQLAVSGHRLMQPLMIRHRLGWGWGWGTRTFRLCFKWSSLLVDVTHTHTHCHTHTLSLCHTHTHSFIHTHSHKRAPVLFFFVVHWCVQFTLSPRKLSLSLVENQVLQCQPVHRIICYKLVILSVSYFFDPPKNIVLLYVGML